MCGEKRSSVLRSFCMPGSPPHVRGKGRINTRACAAPRITPACAGKRRSRSPVRMFVQDHPRMCGEKPAAAAAVQHQWGSPPHVRGKGPCSSSFPAFEGITPACAGKSPCAGVAVPRPEDHPRMCGEKVHVHHPFQPLKGSPPHVRGKAHAPVSLSHVQRITPACAGKSQRRRRRCNINGDHPRMCGEKLRQDWFLPYELGSPPHVRGKAKECCV